MYPWLEIVVFDNLKICFMGQYEHLKIYKSIYDFMVELYKYIKDFPKEYKYSLGEKLKSYSLELLISIYKINSCFDKQEKQKLLQNSIALAEKIKILLRLSKDIHILSIKHFTSISVKNI